MLRYFLDRFEVNSNYSSVDCSTVVRAIDQRTWALYDARKLVDVLGKQSDSLVSLFYNKLITAYFLWDTGFNNSTWGIDISKSCPMEYIPVTPFAPKDTFMKYTWGSNKITPDYMILIVRDKCYIKEACRLTYNWISKEFDTPCDYNKFASTVNLIEFMEHVDDINTRVNSMYYSLLTYMTQQPNFLEWLYELPETSTIERVRIEGLLSIRSNPNDMANIIKYFLQYLEEGN